ncbi:MAG: hypothetical protein IKQ68_05645 [Prevotella sp.]|nr:hypothetical protein [Prevotella sp.]
MEKRSNMKRKYMTPTVDVVALQQLSCLLANSRIVTDLSELPENIVWDDDDLDDDDILR